MSMNVPPTVQEVAGQVQAAIESADLEAFRDLLDPNVRWGPADDSTSGCTNREQLLAWYRRGRAAGARATVTEIVVGNDKLLVGLDVVGTAEATNRGGRVDRWQVLTLAGGRVVDIRGFDDRGEALARVGVAD